MAKKAPPPKAPVSPESIAQCLAYAMTEGDIVNFRFLFSPNSPLRDDSTEEISSVKYAYLLPHGECGAHYDRAFAEASSKETEQFVRAQLVKKGPAQLPSELVLTLADNAVRLGKYTSAAQAYELLRIRGRMQAEFLSRGDEALDGGDVPLAVRAYLIATGMEYDYAAFPEPLPAVPNYQARALMLHAQYPTKASDCVALQAAESHVNAALAYLLGSPEAAARLEKRPMKQRVDIVEEIVRCCDPGWEGFAERYRKASAQMRELGARFQREANRREGVEISLADEIEDQQEELDPGKIPEILLGRGIEQGEWWQYLKELAYRHPASALFVARQVVSKDLEVIVPRYTKDSELAGRLGLAS